MAAQTHRRARVQPIIWMTFILLMAAGLFIHSATVDTRFHSDEALYSTYARDAVAHGRWMLDGPLDKPPLSIYANALAMHFFAARITPQDVINVPLRVGEIAAKIPNVFAGLLFVALIYALSCRLYPGQQAIALIAALLAAVSPFNRAYSGSAFTDMLMLCFMTATLYAIIRQRPGIAGVALGLSIGAKPQGVLYLPLALGLMWFQRRSHIKRDAVHLILGLSLVLGGLLVWDSLRPETSFWTLGAVNISQDRLLAPFHEWPERLGAWLTHGKHLLGPAWLTAALVILSVGNVITRRHTVDVWLALNALGLFGLHWVGAFFTFDRYLLVLTPLLVILSARGFQSMWGMRPSGIHAGAAIITLTILVIMGSSATHDPRRDVFRSTTPDGYFNAAARLNDKPLGTIIYDRWLGWEMRYYMGAWSDKRRVYYPTPEDMVPDALQNPDPAPRYLIAPQNRAHEARDWLDALQAAGFSTTLDYQADGFLIYQVIPPWSSAR